LEVRGGTIHFTVPALKPVDPDVPDGAKIPLDAEDFYGITVDFPAWTDMFQHAVQVIFADTLKAVELYGPGQYLAIADDAGKLKDPTPMAIARVDTEGNAGADRISALALAADPSVEVSNNNTFSLLPIKFMLNNPIGDPALVVSNEPAGTGVGREARDASGGTDVALEALEAPGGTGVALDELPTGIYTIRAVFGKQGYKDLSATWRLSWVARAEDPAPGPKPTPNPKPTVTKPSPDPKPTPTETPTPDPPATTDPPTPDPGPTPDPPQPDPGPTPDTPEPDPGPEGTQPEEPRPNDRWGGLPPRTHGECEADPKPRECDTYEEHIPEVQPR
jgi:hypothetical protein